MVQSKDSGFHQLYLSLLTLCAVKGFVWFRVLMTKTRETETQICLGKEQYIRETGPQTPGCLWMHLYKFIHRKRMYSHLYRGVALRLLSPEEGTSFSINCILLALMHTWRTHAHTHTHSHTHSKYTVRSTADDLRGGRGTVWMIGSADCDKQSSTNFLKTSMKSEDVTLISENSMRPTEQICVLISTMNSPGRKSSLESVGAATSYILFFGTLLLCQTRFPYQTLGRHE